MARVKSDDAVRTWISKYRAEHAEDDPAAAHVQILQQGGREDLGLPGLVGHVEDGGVVGEVGGDAVAALFVPAAHAGDVLIVGGARDPGLLETLFERLDAGPVQGDTVEEIIAFVTA